MRQAAETRDAELERLFNLSHDALGVAGFDGYLKLANPAFAEMLGLTMEELTARPYIETVHPADREAVAAALAALQAGRDLWGFECRHLCADGSVRWLEWNTHTWPEEGVVYGVGRDVTERRVATRELSALHRLGTRVAGGVRPQDLFADVAEEAARVAEVSLLTIARYEPEGVATACASFAGAEGLNVAVGTRWPLDPGTVIGRVHATGRPATVTNYTGLRGDVAAEVRSLGIRSAVGCPVVVERRTWGVIVASSTDPEPLPATTEGLLADFAKLLGIAIANAESLEALERLADEQAALRRVAELVAREASPDELFNCVTEEVGRLLDIGVATMHVFADDGTFTTVAAWYTTGRMPRLGPRGPLDPGTATGRVMRSGAPARVHRYIDLDDEPEGRSRRALHSAVSAPIVVEGKLWGALTAGNRGSIPVPEDSGERLTAFAELVATAVANAEARRDLRRLVDEQTALRRVATLAARESAPVDFLEAVAVEAARVLDVDAVGMLRFERDETATLVAQSHTPWEPPPLGTQFTLDGENIVSAVYRTGRPARMDDWSNATGAVAAMASVLGVRSTAACPIVVDGRLWGAMIAATNGSTPLPVDTEIRILNFTELLATAISNAESRSALAASRMRVVTASDEGRRRIERNLHDGIQQQLLTVALHLADLESNLAPGDPARERLEVARRMLGGTIDDLVEIARGIHPAILSEGGLEVALKALARRSAVSAKLTVRIRSRLQEDVEVAAYYVVSEALANVAKHAEASSVQIDVISDDEAIRLAILDDGIGGAEVGRGSGLVGLRDRIDALGGTLSVVSPAGGGTALRVVLPLPVDPNALDVR